MIFQDLPLQGDHLRQVELDIGALFMVDAPVAGIETAGEVDHRAARAVSDERIGDPVDAGRTRGGRPCIPYMSAGILAFPLENARLFRFGGLRQQPFEKERCHRVVDHGICLARFNNAAKQR